MWYLPRAPPAFENLCEVVGPPDGLHTFGMHEPPKFDANIDYGVISGYFVRLDVEEEGKLAWVALTADDARSLAQRLLAQAGEVDRLNRSGKPPTGPQK
jgi:hypothetical protein